MTDCKMGLVKVSGHGQPSHADRGRAESCSGRELESRGCGQGQTAAERAGGPKEIVPTQNIGAWPFQSLGLLQIHISSSPRTNMKRSLPGHRRWRNLLTLQISVHKPSKLCHEANSHRAGWGFDLMTF